MEINVRNESITRIEVDGIINPANSFGYMGGGVAKVIKGVGGEDIEEEAIQNAPVEIGKALATTSGDLRCDAIIHAPVMRNPSETTDTHKIEQAIRAALELAEEMEMKKLAIPGIGTGVGGVKPEESAEVMIKVLKEFNDKFEKITLIDIDEEMCQAWEKLLES